VSRSGDREANAVPPVFTVREQVTEFVNKWHLSDLESDLAALDRDSLDDEQRVLETLEQHVDGWSKEYGRLMLLKGDGFLAGADINTTYQKKLKEYQEEQGQLAAASASRRGPDDPVIEQLRASVAAKREELIPVAFNHLDFLSCIHHEGANLLSKLRTSAKSKP